jgi:hypothetical protein
MAIGTPLRQDKNNTSMQIENSYMDIDEGHPSKNLKSVHESETEIEEDRMIINVVSRNKT